MSSGRLCLFLFFSIAFTQHAAWGQVAAAIVCNGTAQPLTVRAEGLTEMTGDIIIQCTGGTIPSSGSLLPQANISITLSTNVTSRLLNSSITETLLFIDDPQPGSQSPCAPSAGSTTCTPLTAGSGGVALDGSGTARNIFQGIRQNDNTVVFLGVPIYAPGGGVRVFRVKNVRAAIAGSSAANGQIIAFISIANPPANLQLSNASVVVGFVQQGLIFGTRSASGGAFSGSTLRQTFLYQCETFNGDLASSPAGRYGGAAIPVDRSFQVRFRESYAASLAVRDVNSPLANPGVQQNVPQNNKGVPATSQATVESGFFNTSFPSTNGLNQAGRADHGSRLRAAFSNVPAGVRVYVSTGALPSSSTPASDCPSGFASNQRCGGGETSSQATALGVATNASGGNGSGNTVLANPLSDAEVGLANTGIFSGGRAGYPPGATQGLVEVPIVGGAGSFTWEVFDEDPNAIDTLSFAVTFAFNPSGNISGTVAVNGSFAPLSTINTMSASAPAPRFADQSTAFQTTSFNGGCVAVNLATSPATNLQVALNGSAGTAPQSYVLGSGTTNTISVPSPQPAGVGARYAFSSWSDSGGVSHSITVPGSAATFTASFVTQYQLTTQASPAAGGTINANPSSTDGYYNVLSNVQLTAVPSSGYTFAGFSGSLGGTTNPQSVTMSAARSVTASFTCAYSLSAGSAPFGSAGGSGSVNVTAGTGCTWTATGQPSWITITSGASGSGNGTVNYTVAANPGVARSVTLTIAGQSYTVNQGLGCSFSLSAANASFTSAGGGGSVNVIAAAGCNWSVAGQPSWITITGGASGSGNGTVTYTVGANSGGPRSAILTIAGQPYTVNQDATCSYSLSAASAPFGSAGGNGSVNVTAAAGCTWTATGQPSWITITSGGSGSGNGTVTYTVGANPGAPRSATLTIAGQPYTVNQGVGCSYSLSAASASFDPAGGSGSFNVIAPAGCAWSVTGAPSWVTITGGATGNGNGAVSFNAAATASGMARSAILTIFAGVSFTINQAGLGCVFKLTPPGVSLAATGTPGIVNVNASAADCSRTAVSNAPWITVTSGASGTGTGAVGYTVEANTGPTSRNGSITIGGQTFNISQTGVQPCTQSLPQSTQSFGFGAGSGSATISTQAGCAWSATSDVPWITITTGSGVGPGAFAFNLAANTATDARTGTITTTAGVFTVQQAGIAQAISCAVSNSAVAPAVRAEGRTELTMDLAMTCTGSAAAGGFAGDLMLRLNVPVTSRKLSAADDASEALLLIGNPVSPQIGANAFLGRVAGYNLLRWSGVRLLPAGINVTQTFRITNVRVDASVLGLPPGSPLPIVATLSVAGQTTIPVSNATPTLALASQGAVFSRGSAAQVSGTQYAIPLSFREALPGAFKLRLAESGYSNAGLLGNAVGLAETATRLRIRVTNIPPGAQLSVSLASADGKATLVSGADENGAGGAAGPGAAGYTPLSVANGVGTATWEVLNTDPAVLETLTFQLLAGSGSLADFDNTQISGSLGPVSAVGVSSAIAPIPRFRDFAVPEKLVKLRARTVLSTGTRPLAVGPVPRSATAGGNVTFLSTIVNDSDINAPGVVIHDVLPSTLTLTSCVAAGGSCAATSDGVNVVYPVLLPGQSVTITIGAQIAPSTPAGAIIENIVSATSDNLGSDLDASTASVSFAVTGGCTYGLSRTTASVGASGDVGKVDVITAPGCPWTASSNVNWITLPAQAAPQTVGPGTQLYTVAENPSATQRSTVLTIADQAFQVTQAANGCVITLPVSSAQTPAGGGNFTFSVAAPANCAWTASAAPGWITLPAGASGMGTGPVAYAVAQNAGASPRTGTITVAGTAIQIVQRSGAAELSQFTDVPVTDPYFDYIRLLRDNAITTGCTPTQYCPESMTTRGQMAVFIIRSLYGDNFAFPSQAYFTDVPADTNFKYIQKMRELGITSGCTATRYCPNDPVSRGEMAVFLIRARLRIAAGTEPPRPDTPFFTDVPTTHPYFSFIQKMRELGITSGCTATAYCANNPTTRGQMAVFLIRAFFTP